MGAPQLQYAIPAGGGVPVGVAGTGTVNRLTKFATASSIGDSVVTELAGKIGINVVPGTLLSVGDGIVAPPSYDGIRLGNTSEALFSSSDSIRTFRAGITGSTVVVGSTTSHDLLLQRGNVTALTLGASGAVAFAGNLTSSAAQTWTLASSASALNIQSGLLNLDTANSRVGIGTASPGRLLTLSAIDTTAAPSVAQTTVIRLVNPTTTIGTGCGIQFGHDNTTGQTLAQISEILTSTANAWTGDLAISLKASPNASSLTEYVRFQSGGNVGIGTASPYTSLSVRTAAAGGIGAWSLTVTSAGSPIGGSLFLGDDNYYNSGFYNKAPGLSAVYEASSGLASALAFYSYNGSRTERMRIDAAGNVGIGTTSPTAALHLPAGTTARASLNITSGAAPTAPNNGDIWFDGTNIKMQIGGVTRTFTLV